MITKYELNKESSLTSVNNNYEMVDHPQHYGGKDNPYEAIKVIEAWNLNFNLGSCLKYISRKSKPDASLDEKHKRLEDLKKSRMVYK